MRQSLEKFSTAGQAGSNTAIMSGALEETASEFAAKYLPKPKKRK